MNAGSASDLFTEWYSNCICDVGLTIKYSAGNLKGGDTMGIEWINHKGKRILYIDYGKLSVPEMVAQVKKATETLVASGSSQNLTLSNISDAFVNNEFIAVAKEHSKISLPLTKKTAVVGVTGVKKILLKGLNTFTSKPRVPFDTIEQAKDWLVQ